MLIQRRAVCLSALLLLSSCAETTPYVAPTSGETATLTVVNQATTPLDVYTFKVAIVCKDRLSIVSRLPSKEEKTTQIAAGGEWSFQMYTADTNMNLSCATSGGFIPQKGGSYRVAFRIGPDGRTCSATVARTDSNEPVQLRRKRTLRQQNKEDPACAPA